MKNVRTILMLAVICLTWLTTGCLSLSPETQPARNGLSAEVETQERAAFWETFAAEEPMIYAWTVETPWTKPSPMVMVVKTSRTRPEWLSAIGTLPTGQTVFSVTMDHGAETRKYISPAVPDVAKKYFFDTLGTDLANLFLETAAPDVMEQYGGEPLRLIERRVGTFPRRRWQACYYGWNEQTGRFSSIQYKNFFNGVLFTLQEAATEQGESQ